MHDISASRSSRTLLQIVYHTIAAAILLLFVSFRDGQAIWSLEPRATVMLYVVVVAYWLAAFCSIVLARHKRGISGAARLAVSFAAATLVFAIGAILNSGLSNTLSLWTPLLGLVLLLFGQYLHSRLTWTLVAATALLAGVGLALVRAAPQWMRARELANMKPSVSEFRIRSSLYDLLVTSFRNYTPRSSKPRGGLAVFADRYLLATGDGELLAFRPSPDMRSLDVQSLVYKIPVNADEFVKASNNAFQRGDFRVGDVISQQRNGLHRIVATHHYWKSDERCWVMRVSSLQGSLEAFLSESPTLQWKTEFETRPCMPLALPGQPPRFGALESGGRLAWLADDRLLVTFGDHHMDGWNSVVQTPQDEAYSFGKIISLDLSNGRDEIYSLGHRNPQGLAVSSLGKVWSTEHGPEGGDELNLIEKDGNYGWPFATYGTEYGSFSWPLIPEEEEKENDNFLEPFYSWVPSIGVTSLIEVTSPRFGRWRGDLVVSSLRDKSLWRLRIREARVVMAERFPFGERIREVLQGHDGKLVVWTDDRSIHFVAPAAASDDVSGASIYRICARCHVAPADGVAATAPSLVGVMGRAVASDPDFQYSPALRALGGTWTKERLDAFLADTSGYAPGTSMTFTGIRDAASREAVIDFLASPENRLDLKPDRRTRVDAPQYSPE